MSRIFLINSLSWSSDKSWEFKRTQLFLPHCANLPVSYSTNHKRNNRNETGFSSSGAPYSRSLQPHEWEGRKGGKRSVKPIWTSLREPGTWKACHPGLTETPVRYLNQASEWKFSKPQFPHLWNGNDHCAYLLGLLGGPSEDTHKPWGSPEVSCPHPCSCKDLSAGAGGAGSTLPSAPSSLRVCLSRKE